MSCLDSNFIVDFLDPETEHHDEAKEWMREHRDEPITVPYICAFEVLRGAERSDEEGGRVISFLRSDGVDVPRSGLPEAAKAAETDARLHAEGAPLSARDTLVASCARRLGQTLVTRDRDFGDAVDTDFYV